MPSPSLQQIYQAKYNNPADFSMKRPARTISRRKCLYMWVMTAIPEAKSTFSGSEIADVDGDGWNVFIDGWGNPIGFLRWAPGATRLVGHPNQRYAGHNGGLNMHHDPFDPNFVETRRLSSLPADLCRRARQRTATASTTTE